jgi:hypothetical protein
VGVLGGWGGGELGHPPLPRCVVLWWGGAPPPPPPPSSLFDYERVSLLLTATWVTEISVENWSNSYLAMLGAVT